MIPYLLVVNNYDFVCAFLTERWTTKENKELHTHFDHFLMMPTRNHYLVGHPKKYDN